MARKKYFTAREINGLIPKLEKVFDQVDEWRRRAESLVGQMPKRSEDVTPASAGQTQMIRSETMFLMMAVEDNVNYIARLGGVVKDLDEGLVDFPAQVHGEPAWLCWRRGESQVRFWHALDEGFSERQFLQPENRSTFH